MANNPGPTSPLSGIDEQTIADTALIVEALAAFAGPSENLDTRRERRAWELISTLADDLRMTPSELLRRDTHLQPRTL
jgi:N-methylhydantoinase A/oxoprolinase/acetone carboxylase beta subunit